MGCNCRSVYPGYDMYRWESCCSTPNMANYPTKEEMSAYTYSKQEVDDKIEDIIISGGGITSGEVQTMIDNSIIVKADKDTVYTKTETVELIENSVWVEDGILHIGEPRP